MDIRALYFTGPGQVEVREAKLEAPAQGQALVRTLCSAISPGTEMLVYRGQAPDDMDLDANIAALAGGFRYPLQYGYSSVGEVLGVGAWVDPAWVGRKVFSFQPHQSHFLARMEDLLPLPQGTEPERAAFLPNAETAVNFVMDGRPLYGETAAVFGLGIVGLLTSALLRAFPLGGLAALDCYPRRRGEGQGLGADLVMDPGDASAFETARQWLEARGSAGGFDLVYELSGSPAALDQAIALTGYAGRVVLGSWYGSKRATLNLGGRFHRSRIQILASQVSSVAPELSGRWTKARRMAAAWGALQRIGPERWISQRYPLERAAEAYQLIDHRPDETIQVIFTYN